MGRSRWVCGRSPAGLQAPVPAILSVAWRGCLPGFLGLSLTAGFALPATAQEYRPYGDPRESRSNAPPDHWPGGRAFSEPAHAFSGPLAIPHRGTEGSPWPDPYRRDAWPPATPAHPYTPHGPDSGYGTIPDGAYWDYSPRGMYETRPRAPRVESPAWPSSGFATGGERPWGRTDPGRRGGEHSGAVPRPEDRRSPQYRPGEPIPYGYPPEASPIDGGSYGGFGAHPSFRY
jgi:hypothetical protein